VRFALVFAESTPHAIGFAYFKGVFGALHPHRAPAADLFGGCLSLGPSRAAFPFGVEKNAGILATAGTLHLPVPQISVGAGEARDVCHGLLLT